MGVARRDVVNTARSAIYVRNERPWQLVAYELILGECREPLGEAKTAADSEIAAPGDNWDGGRDYAGLVGVIADGSVETATRFSPAAGSTRRSAHLSATRRHRGCSTSLQMS